MNWEVRVALDRAEYREFMEVQTKRRVRAVLPAMALCLLLQVFLLTIDVWVCLLGLGAAVMFLVIYWGAPSIAAGRGWKSQSRVSQTGLLIYRFAEGEFTTEHPMASSQIRYTSLTRLVETETLLILYGGSRQAWVLPKNSFTVGKSRDFCDFLSQTTRLPWQTVATAKLRRRRTAVTVATLAIAFTVIIVFEGVQYIRRPVTFGGEQSTCTIDLPYFLQFTPTDGSNTLYTGNDITVSVDFSTMEQLQRRYDSADYQEPLTLKTYAAYEQAHGGAHPEGEWIEDNDTATEWYMQYAGGADYVCTVLRWTEDGCWKLTFRCPGERQDTYYNRFTTWRKSAVYTD